MLKFCKAFSILDAIKFILKRRLLMKQSVECRRCHLYIPEECESCPHCSSVNSPCAVGLKYKHLRQVREGVATVLIVFKIGIILSLILIIYFAAKYV